MRQLPVSIIEVSTPKGAKKYLALTTPELSFERGVAPEAIVGEMRDEWDASSPIQPSSFVVNSVFTAFLHSCIARYAPKQAAFLAEAKRQESGYIFIVDQRTPTPDGPVPPEDIIGVISIEQGNPVEGSYQRSPNHRVMTDRGFVGLPDGLLDCLVCELRQKL